jgi:N6-L-threonylcarbamoyladenine synthase
VLAATTRRALELTGQRRLVVAGGVGANAQLRARLQEDARRHGTEVHFPPLELCTDNGAMIALAGLAALRRADPAEVGRRLGYAVHPRWSLAEATA